MTKQFKPTHICMNEKCPTNCYAGATWSPISVEEINNPNCDYCGLPLYKIDNYLDKELGYEIVLYQDKNWKITVFATLCDSGWIVGDKGKAKLPVGDLWIKYIDGEFAFDHPNLIPKYVKNKLRTELKKLERMQCHV